MKKDWMKFLLAYGLWFVFILVGLLILIVSRNGVIALLNVIGPKDSLDWPNQAKFIDRAYFLTAGIALLILMILVEEYFKKGVTNGQLARRAYRSFGIEVIFLFAATFLMAYLIGFSPLIILALAGLLLAGIVLIWLSARSSRTTVKP